MMEKLTLIMAIVLFCGVMLASCVLTVSVWNECRLTNSFFYCLRMVGK